MTMIFCVHPNVNNDVYWGKISEMKLEKKLENVIEDKKAV